MIIQPAKAVGRNALVENVPQIQKASQSAFAGMRTQGWVRQQPILTAQGLEFVTISPAYPQVWVTTLDNLFSWSHPYLTTGIKGTGTYNLKECEYNPFIKICIGN
jgi:hypothetical protein